MGWVGLAYKVLGRGRIDSGVPNSFIHSLEPWHKTVIEDHWRRVTLHIVTCASFASLPHHYLLITIQGLFILKNVYLVFPAVLKLHRASYSGKITKKKKKPYNTSGLQNVGTYRFSPLFQYEKVMHA